jgi:FkbM family methyltransferase
MSTPERGRLSTFGKKLEKFVRRIVGRKRLDDFLRCVQGVVHVGANTGQERSLYSEYGLKVIWVEPITEVFDELVVNLAGYPEQRAIRGLLTDQDDVEYDFGISSNKGKSSSVLPLARHREMWPRVEYVESRRMRGITLQSLFRRERLSVREYQALVMDVQGAELMVLKGAGDLLRDFRFIKAEAADFESYAGGARLDDLQIYLQNAGFAEMRRHQSAHDPAIGTYWDVVWERRQRD